MAKEDLPSENIIEEVEEERPVLEKQQSSKDLEEQIALANARVAAAKAEIEALKAENTLILEKTKLEKAKQVKEAKETEQHKQQTSSTPPTPSTDQNFNWTQQASQNINQGTRQMPSYMNKREFAAEMKNRIVQRIKETKRI